MASFVNVTLDTTAPAGVALDLDAETADQEIVAGVATTDPDTAGYTMKLWGDVDESFDADVQEAEGDSAWVSFSATQTVRLSSGDGTKTLNLRVRDDVDNASGTTSGLIDLIGQVVAFDPGPPEAPRRQLAVLGVRG
jgi:hypothetical protein